MSPQRYWYVGGLVIVLLVAALFWILMRQVTLEQVITPVEQGHITLSRRLPDELWRLLDPEPWSRLPADVRQMRSDVPWAQLESQIRDHIAGSATVALSIYTLDGMPLLTTDSRRVDRSPSVSREFRMASDGRVASAFLAASDLAGSATSGRHNVLVSYVPLRRSADGSVTAVMEALADVTPMLQIAHRAHRQLLLWLVVLLLAVCAVIVFVARGVQRLFREQQAKHRRDRTELEFRATHDLLTGLPNRFMLQDRLGQSIAHARRQNRLVAVLLLDLDGFKEVNDSLGHQFGDRLLVTVAERLKSCVRREDTVARMGGDEFGVVLGDATHVEQVTGIAERILETVAGVGNLDGKEVSITASIGITIFPDDDGDVESLLGNADMAMYRAKERGSDTFQLYDIGMHRRNSERLAMCNNLRRALRCEEFVLYYQPQINMLTGTMDGMEALLRWRNPDTGMVMPARFIPLLEENGLIVPVGEWVIRTASAQNRLWQLQGLRPMCVAVNISPRQFKQTRLSARVGEILEDTGLDPSYLELEITENLVMDDVETSGRILRELKALGVRIAIDDFGTGYSSLSHLKRFPIDTLKIDRSFVRTMLTNKDDSAIVTAITALAHNLRLKLVAEGVEEEDQYAFLHALRCHNMQGYLFEKPRSADDFEALLREDRPLRIARPLAQSVV